MDQFLRNHASASASECTHTRIGSPDHNVYGGSYTITEKDEFYKFILNQDSTLPPNAIIYYKGHALKKVLVYQQSKYSWNMWESIYELDPKQ